MRPRLLDLFCGAGGAARGYQQAGFHVIGVDIEAQPNYCGDDFLRQDVFDFADHTWRGKAFHRWEDFDAVHASPPCQAFTSLSNRWRGQDSAADHHENLIAAIRDLLERVGLPYVIENVEGARRQLLDPVVVCGSSVGLSQSRHRLFECGGWRPLVPSCYCRGREFKGVYGVKPDGRWIRRKPDGTRSNFIVSSIEEGRDLLGIDWMSWDELKEAVPPAYTEMLGLQLRDALTSSTPPETPVGVGGDLTVRAVSPADEAT